jgi:hypothetical protein
LSTIKRRASLWKLPNIESLQPRRCCRLARRLEVGRARSS